MATTDNGWPARRDLPLRSLVVDGVAFVPGIVDDDAVAAVLGYVAEQFHQRVEPLRNPGCWGFSYRENRNKPNALSRHSGGIAIDANAPAHPNGVPTARTFTPAQIAEVHRILAEVDHVVRWGGDYSGVPDAMHFEINADRTAVQAVAARLEADMPLNDADKKFIRQAIKEEVSAQFAQEQKNGRTLRQNVLAIAKKLGVQPAKD